MYSDKIEYEWKLVYDSGLIFYNLLYLFERGGIMDLKYFERIPNSNDWVNLEVLSKGYSGDKKYKVVDRESNKFLLRISNVSTYESRKKQYDLLCKLIH